jgi:hypothetical protein
MGSCSLEDRKELEALIASTQEILDKSGVRKKVTKENLL